MAKTTKRLALKPLYSPKEISDALGVSLRTVRDWLSSGDLPSEKIGGKIFIPLSGLSELYPAFTASLKAISAIED